MKKIITKEGNEILCDDEDYEFLAQFTWRTRKRSHSYPYVTNISPHQLLMIKKNKNNVIDHIDRNPFNNQKENLREVSQHQNIMNTSKTKNKTSSRFKGVYYHKAGKKYVVFCAKKYRGSFSSEIDAAKEYNKHAKHLFGEFAALNQIPEMSDSPTQLALDEGYSADLPGDSTPEDLSGLGAGSTPALRQ